MSTRSTAEKQNIVFTTPIFKKQNLITTTAKLVKQNEIYKTTKVVKQNEITPIQSSESPGKVTINTLNTKTLDEQNKTDCEGLHSTSFVFPVVLSVLIAVLVLNIVLLKYWKHFYGCRKTDIGSSVVMLISGKNV